MTDTELEERLQAHRMAFAALAMVMADITPGALDAIIMALGTFEEGMRQQNYPDAQVDEIRTIRVRLTGMAPKIPDDPFPGTHRPRGDTDR